MMKLTELEKDALTACYRSEYHDESNPDARPAVWDWSVTDNCEVVTAKQVSGVISSLSKKGLVVCEEYDNENTISVTEKGHEIYTSELRD